MPTKAELFAQMADQKAVALTKSWQEWAAFLTTAARLYKYPYHEQLLIYAQRPDATACADYDLWNQKMGRYVRRGTKGIALLDDSGDRPRLRYVFDVSDTGTTERSRAPWLWNMEQRHIMPVSTMLTQRYHTENTDIAQQLTDVAQHLAGEYWNDHKNDICDIVEDSFLEEYDEFNLGVQFKGAVTVSVAYALMSRCGLEPEQYFEHEDFMPIFDFNTPATVAAMGTAVSQINQEVLRQIGVTILNAEREAVNERRTQDEQHTDLHAERGLSGSEPAPERTANEAPGKVRTDAESVPEAEPPHPVQSDAAERETVSSLPGDRGNGKPASGRDDAAAGAESRGDRGTESQRPDEMGGADEHLQGADRRDPDDRAYQQLSLNLFLSEAEQIHNIEEAENVHTSSAFSFAQADIDHVLRLGGNTEHLREQVVAEFEKQKAPSAIAAVLSDLYHGGNGFITENGKFSAWYAEDGIHLSRSSAARYDKTAQIVTWESAAQRIGQLLEVGQYATNVELAECAGYERRQLAERLWYLEHDLSEDASKQFLPLMKNHPVSGFPDETAYLSQQLCDPEFRSRLIAEYETFQNAYAADPKILRFHYHRTQELGVALAELQLPRKMFESAMSTVPAVQSFITEDELDAAISGGSNVAGGKGRIFAFFSAGHSTKEKAEFLKQEYGTGGHSHALSSSFGSSEDHDAKGERFQKKDCPEVKLSWDKVANRIDSLIRKGRYLSDEEQQTYNQIQAERALADTAETEHPFTGDNEVEADELENTFVSVYNDTKAQHPDDLVLFQVGDFFELYGEDAKTAAANLELTLTTRAVAGAGRVPMCGFPANMLGQMTDKLRDKYDVTISAVQEHGAERQVYSMPSIDREAEQAIDVHEAEFGADGYRAFREPPAPSVREPITQALQEWNGDMDSKRAVARYMESHGREKETAAWLAQEYGGDKPFIIGAGTPEEMVLPWPKVQREIAKLIKQDRFFTEQEQADLENIDPIALRENLAARGIVNGEVVDPEKLDNDPFIQQVMHDAEQIDTKMEVNSEGRFSILEVEGGGYVVWDNLNDGVYVDDNGIGEQLQTREEAEDYLAAVEAKVEDQTAADWSYIEHAKFEAAKGETSDLAASVEAWEAEQAAVRQAAVDALTDQQKVIVNAMEAAGFLFTPQSSDSDLVFKTDTDGYPITFESWDDAERWIESAELKDTPGLREQVQAILHPPVSDAEYASLHLIPGETIFEWDGRTFMVDRVNYDSGTVNFQDITFVQNTGFPIFRTEPIATVRRYLETQPVEQDKEVVSKPRVTAENFHITDTHLGEGGPKAKYIDNLRAIQLLKQLELEDRQAEPDEQEILSRYVGWGGLSDAFDPSKDSWRKEYQDLKEALTPAEYDAARASTLNAHYTSPTVIQAIYEAVGRMGFETGNILEPSCGVGNFFGMLPQQMQNSRLYGVELDSISGRLAQKLYPQANITVAGFETTDRKDFFDLAIGNVPFGQYQVNDRAYNKLNFNIHNYFFAKALDQVRPGGVVAFVTSRYTMDAKDSTVRRYLAQRADLLGAIRLPNNAFKKNAGAEVVSDIIFLQKRDRPLDIVPDWTQTALNDDGFAVNRYFLEHPEMVLGNTDKESTAHGMDYTVTPIESLELSDQLHDAVKYIRGTYQEAELPDLGEGEAIDTSIPADPNVKNFSYTVVDGQVYYRENSRMVRPDLNATAEARVKGMVGLRDCVNKLIDLQMDASTTDDEIRQQQAELNRLYDSFSQKYGLINDRSNKLAFSDDSSYYLLCALEELDEDRNLKRKADMFTKRTIKPHEAVTSVDTASEALAVSIAEKADVDMGYMAQLTGKSEEQLAQELQGVIFRIPAPMGSEEPPHYVTADEYLSGNVRKKLREAQRAADKDPTYAPNVKALQAAQPKDLDASEIEVRLGATWISKEYIQQFMHETFKTPYYLQRSIEVKYTPFTAEWQITGKTRVSYNDIAAYTTYGTDRANAYKILEDSLNLRDVRIYDTIEDADGKERRVLNAKATTLAAQKQQAIRDAFKDWIWKDAQRRQELVRQYNEEMNSTRPREYDGSHIVFGGINPEITLREHQKNAIAHVLYGGNTLLAHEVGAGKTFEMVAAAMEAKRLGLCTKSLFAVPNHLTEQWASEFLRLYPSANILVTTKKDFEPHNRKKFCARIATGDYDAIIMGHSQFEKIPISQERQERLLQEQIWEITEGISEVQASGGERFTVKQLERTKRGLEQRLEKLQAQERKDDVVSFEQLGVDRLFVDEAHNYKNLFLYTKMRNVAGLSTTDAQKSSDMFAKCRYLDEITESRGVVFATGTPVSNSMTELYTMQRYLQFERLRELNMVHFDCWASRFGETATALELAPEGTGYRARTRFSKFFNLPELMNLFREVADIKTADQLHLPTPEVEYHNIVAKPTEHQQEMVKALSERAAEVHSGSVDPSEDNMLKITSDGRKLGLDQRIINDMLPDEPGTKVNQCVSNIMQIWRDGQTDKLTQLVFCDISTPKASAPSKKVAKALDNPTLHALEDAVTLDAPEPAFTVYEDIRQKLIAQGVPPQEIAFIHEANTEVRKKELFSKVRTGQVRVLLGSTSKMGAGTNVQDRLVALHDLDCPWRPGDLAQRKGRIERQGNQNEKVHVFRYVTEGTFDAYLWQTVENKQKFISQIMSSKSPVRACEDVDETALSFAEIKALCAGDPRIKERMDLDVEVSRLKLMKADHQSKQYRLEDQLLKYFPQEIEAHKGFIKGFEADMETLAAHPHPTDGFAGMEVRGDLLTDKENAGAALLDACREVKSSEPVQLGTYRGFTMSVAFDAFNQEYKLQLKGQMTHRVELGKDPRGNLTRIDNALAAMPDRMGAVKAQLDNLYQQQSAAKDQSGKPFPQEAELSAKTARLIELDSELNMDGKGRAQSQERMEKRSKPSIMEQLKRPVPVRASEHKPKHPEKEER